MAYNVIKPRCNAKQLSIGKSGKGRFARPHNLHRMIPEILKYILPLIAILSLGCSESPQPGFVEWYNNQGFTFENRGDNFTKVHTHETKSANLTIDTILRSMQGPLNIKEVTFKEDAEKLVWLVGYESAISDAVTGTRLPDAFMCHNNLNIRIKSKFPWMVRTQGTSTRLFTLTEGQTAPQLPKGFGIPIPADQPMNMISQVLNHNNPEVDLQVTHDVQIHYVKQSDLTAPLVPLYQQGVFILRQESGPTGDHGLPTSCADHYHKNKGKRTKQGGHTCEMQYDDENFNPYADRFGRSFTSHWAIPLGRQILTTNVTRLMNLQFDTRVHYIGVHMHPFAHSLELRDITTDSSLFTAHIQNSKEVIGIEHIDHYSSEEGFAVFKDHQYEIVSTYECTDSINVHTAMAVMFLYFRDK